jgi:HSP20 family protein
MSRYKRKYFSNHLTDFIIPLLALVFVALLYGLVARITLGYTGLFLLAITSGLMIYWVRELKKMIKVEYLKPEQKDIEGKGWFYDLIKNNDEMVFVAEVPGPENQINIMLASGILHIKGGRNFVREIPIEINQDMSISDLKYRNGVLTIKIHRV